MIQNTILANISQKESIKNITYFKNQSSPRTSKNLTSPLILTPLIDVFSILVVYLLLSFSTAKDMPYLSQEVKLPSAKNGTELENHIIIKFKNGKYFIENIEVSKQKLAKKLLEYQSQSISKSKNALIIQADKKEKYRHLNEIVLAANRGGYSDIKFVVLSGPPQWLKQQ